jgi:hypothetical protein
VTSNRNRCGLAWADKHHRLHPDPIPNLGWSRTDMERDATARVLAWLGMSKSTRKRSIEWFERRVAEDRARSQRVMKARAERIAESFTTIGHAAAEAAGALAAMRVEWSWQPLAVYGEPAADRSLVQLLAEERLTSRQPIPESFTDLTVT